MSKRIPVGPIDHVTAGQPHRFDVAGVGTIAVYRVEDAYYATSDACTHSVASLGADGELEGFTIVCSWHGGKFDIRTGQAVGPPCVEPLKTYPVSVEGSMLLIEVEE